MFTIKRLEKEATIKQVQLTDKIVSFRTGRKVTFAVIDASGEIAKSKNGQYEIYEQKSTAQQVADWYNSK